MRTSRVDRGHVQHERSLLSVLFWIDGLWHESKMGSIATEGKVKTVAIVERDERYAVVALNGELLSAWHADTESATREETDGRLFWDAENAALLPVVRDGVLRVDSASEPCVKTR